MKICFRSINYFSFLIFALISCTEQPKSQPIEKHSDTLSQKSFHTPSKTSSKYKASCIRINFKNNNEFNNITSLLTGDKQNGQYNQYYDSSYWEIYHEFIHISWDKLEKQRLNKIRTWREKEIKITDTLTHTVFYPFSGPDFLTASVMFPQADTFILLGLEPVGVLPDFSRMSVRQQQEYLSSFCGALGDIFNKSYFITKKMLNDFQSQKVNGLLPVMSFFIKKLNYNIADIKFIYKDSTQQIKEINYHSNIRNKYFGVKITATKDSCAKTIYYFRYNVMDKFFNDSTVFYHYLSKYHHYITYIKSASYLLHNPFMTNMRKLILSNSVAILQDDTGVPYKYLSDTNEWKLKLYGEYDKPVKDFGKMGYQPELAKRMKQDSAFIPKLPFHLGYHWGTKKDVLFFALKKQFL